MTKQEELFSLVKQAMRLHHDCCDRAMNSQQMHQGQFPIMVYIERHPECCLSDISTYFNISRASVSKSIDRLVNSGQVAKTPAVDDRRICRLRLTAAGQAGMDAGHRAFKRPIDSIFYGFAPEELAQIEAYLRRIIGNLQPASAANKEVL